ncbi:MAG: hypothetical protein IJE19_03150 [Clostridia bacterium]|nr:hypothetical protein [Clostridia bacterium]
MASKRLLKDTVVIKNYIGEVNDTATYQETILEHCYCPCNYGVGTDGHGRNSIDNTRLYIFDCKTVAKSSDGKKRSYLPYQSWILSESKEDYWTLNDAGDDYFVKEGVEFCIIDFSYKNEGTRRMWHFEVDGK